MTIVILFVSRCASLLLPTLPFAALAASGAETQGVPGTAMLPKAGFAELPADDVAEAVRYMLSTVGLPPDLPATAAAAAPRPGSAAVAGVREIENRLVSAEIFEHD